MELELKEQLPLFFSTLNLWPMVKKMRSKLPKGAKGFPKDAILRALLAAPMVGISTFTGLVERLESDIRFRYQCGFGVGRSPSIATFSRAFQKITECNLAEELFLAMIKECREKGIINGKVIAIDSTAIEAYEKKQSRAKSKGTGNADWGSKKDSYGNTITWFGYKLHLAVDSASELPLAFEVTPANINDGDMGPTLIEKVTSTAPENNKPQYYVMDAGYDQQKNYVAAHDASAQAIIPFGTAWCTNSNYGMVKKINITEDLRRYSNPHRNTRKWEELYDQRTSVERVNSRLKTYLTANQLHVWGIEKVKTHILLNLIVLLAGALACKQSIQKAA